MWQCLATAQKVESRLSSSRNYNKEQEDDELASKLQQMMHMPECPQCNRPLQLIQSGMPVYLCNPCQRCWPQAFFDDNEDDGERGYTEKELIRILKTDEGLQQLRTCEQCGYMVLETDVVWENQPTTMSEPGTVKSCVFCEEANE